MQEDFEKKKKMLFDCLDSASKSIQGTTLEQKNRHVEISSNPSRKRNRDEAVDKYKQRGSLFKRPDLPINKCLPYRQRPDYEKNPKKYTHYSLEHVDTSDRMNTSAAFSFLKEIEDRKCNDSNMEDDDGSGSSEQKIVFKKSVKLRQKNIEVDSVLDTKKIQSTKVVMPEYVIGEKRQKPRKDKIERTSTSNSKASLHLSHLNDEEDET